MLLVRDTAHRGFVPLRHAHVFDAVAAVVPGLAEWTDPDRAAPITPLLPGGNLVNHFRSQRDSSGAVRLPGLVSVGDAVCTTTPTFGRGLALSMTQARRVLAFVDDGIDPAELPAAFDDFSREALAPWVRDHIAMDDGLKARWRGEDIDLTRPLPSDVVLDASAVDPEILSAALPYLSMAAGPQVMRGVEPRARAVYETGWRPPAPEGPTTTELLALVERTAPDGLTR